MKKENGLFTYEYASKPTESHVTRFENVVLTKPLKVVEETEPLPPGKRFEVALLWHNGWLALLEENCTFEVWYNGRWDGVVPTVEDHQREFDWGEDWEDELKETERVPEHDLPLEDDAEEAEEGNR